MKWQSLPGIITTVAFASSCAAPSSVATPGTAGIPTIRVSGAGQRLTVAYPGRFDLEVSGDEHILRIAPESDVRSLEVSGVHHVITVLAGASVESIRLSGVGTTLHLPKDLHPTVSSRGIHARVIHDVVGTEIPSRSEKTSETP